MGEAFDPLGGGAGTSISTPLCPVSHLIVRYRLVGGRLRSPHRALCVISRRLRSSAPITALPRLIPACIHPWYPFLPRCPCPSLLRAAFPFLPEDGFPDPIARSLFPPPRSHLPPSRTHPPTPHTHTWSIPFPVPLNPVCVWCVPLQVGEPAKRIAVKKRAVRGPQRAPYTNPVQPPLGRIRSLCASGVRWYTQLTTPTQNPNSAQPSPCPTQTSPVQTQLNQSEGAGTVGVPCVLVFVDPPHWTVPLIPDSTKHARTHTHTHTHTLDAEGLTPEYKLCVFTEQCNADGQKFFTCGECPFATKGPLTRERTAHAKRHGDYLAVIAGKPEHIRELVKLAKPLPTLPPPCTPSFLFGASPCVGDAGIARVRWFFVRRHPTWK